MALRWKKNDAETGLRRITAGPRGSRLRLDGVEVASVNAYREGFKTLGWYWVTSTNEALGIEWKNTCNTPVATEQQAKDEAIAYIRAAISGQKPAEGETS